MIGHLIDLPSTGCASDTPQKQIVQEFKLVKRSFSGDIDTCSSMRACRGAKGSPAMALPVEVNDPSCLPSP